MSQEELFNSLTYCQHIFILDVSADGVPVYTHYNTSALRKWGGIWRVLSAKPLPTGAECKRRRLRKNNAKPSAPASAGHEFRLPFDDDIRRSHHPPRHSPVRMAVWFRLIGAAQGRIAGVDQQRPLDQA
jgi:hypothetical protein